MIYEYLTNIDSVLKVKYLSMILIGTFLLKRILDFRTITSIIIILICVYILNEKSNQIGGNFIKDYQYILDLPEFKQYKYLYLDSEIVILVSSIRRYRYYNPAVFRRLIIDINNFLKLTTDMENDIDNMGEIYEILEEYKFKSMNTYMSFIHKIPMTEPALDTFHVKKLELEKLLNNHLDRCYQFMTYKYGKTGMNNRIKFIYKNAPKPLDTSFDKHYEFYN